MRVNSLFATALVLALPLAAQHRQPTVEGALFLSRASLVLVPVTVIDARGATVNGLPRDAFTVFERKAPRRISTFSEQDEPVSIGVIFDASGSMRDALSKAKTALRAFFDAANPGDEAFLYTVSTRPGAGMGFTADFAALYNRVALEPGQGETALVDTIYAGLGQIRKGKHPRKCLLVISDGMDNHSRLSKRELLAYAEESGAEIHTIAFYDPSPDSKPIELLEERRGLQFLSEMASRTGGLDFTVRSPAELVHAVASIGQALRNQYLIGYVPDEVDHDGRWRPIKVKVSVAGARVHARPGYRFE